MQISDRKARRLKTGLTIADMAKLAGADVWTTRDWEDRVTTRSRYHDRFLAILAKAESEIPLSGPEIHDQRMRLGLTLQQLADASGVSQRTVLEVEKHGRGTRRSLWQITSALAELQASPERTPAPRRCANKQHKPLTQLTSTARLHLLRQRHKALSKGAL
ncbi:MAG TPA: hypothetical protein PK472_18835 [Pseudomonadota bacterium]|nr:hypothetical protein [Pseudomonadota bacterium]